MYKCVSNLNSDIMHVLTFVMLLAPCVCKQVACSLCSETMERQILAIHRGENCPQRIVTCEFCEFPLPAIDLAEHQVLIMDNFQ